MKHIPAMQIGELIPNLDCFVSPGELAETRAELKELAQVFTDLSSYAEAKQAAMECRLKGDIATAKRFEHAAEQVYVRIPPHFRW